jgi:hypothetical protein
VFPFQPLNSVPFLAAAAEEEVEMLFIFHSLTTMK